MQTVFESEYQHYTTVIMANGEIPFGEVPLTFLRRAERIICCDGAIEKLLQLGLQPNVIIGDLDSISPTLRQQYRHIIIEDKNTEYNDLQKSLKYCISNNYNNIAIVGASGLRDDHNIANLAILDLYSDKIDVLMVGNKGVFSFISAAATFASVPGQAVSVFCLDGKAVFSFHDLKYPVHKRKFRYLWEGSLNEALSNHFTIEITGGKGIIYRCYYSE